MTFLLVALMQLLPTGLVHGEGGSGSDEDKILKPVAYTTRFTGQQSSSLYIPQGGRLINDKEHYKRNTQSF